MAQNNNIRTVYVGVHLGGAAPFDIRASEDPAATPIECTLSADGLGKRDGDFLLEILHKIEAAYGKSAALSLCVKDKEIKRDSECS